MAKENDEALIALVRELPSHDRSSPERDQWMVRVEGRYSELRGLVETLLVSEPATAAEMVAILWRSWWLGGHVSDPDDSVEMDDAVARLKTGLGDTYDELWAAGRLLTLAEAQAMTQA